MNKPACRVCHRGTTMGCTESVDYCGFSYQRTTFYHVDDTPPCVTLESETHFEFPVEEEEA